MDHIEIVNIPALVAAIEAHVALTGRPAGGICHAAVGNGKLYDRLKAGGDCSISTAARLMDWITAERERLVG